jgi:plasmid stabilization system protein ParE
VKREARKLPEAVEDLYRQGRWYVERGLPETARRFLGAAERAVAQLVTMPEMGARREYRAAELRGLRMWGIRGFREHLVNRPTKNGIEVVRVLHAKRDLEGIFERGK